MLFSTPMVQADLGNRKTQTRRTKGLDLFNTNPSDWEFDSLNFCNDPKIGLQAFFKDKSNGDLLGAKCPYGNVGDVLWVRETALWVMLDHAPDLLQGATDRNQWVYKASTHEDWIEYAKEKYGYKWTPSIHVPKEACRLFLEITNIRVERLNDISEEDAKAEGIDYKYDEEIGYTYRHYLKDKFGPSPVHSFQTLWESINGKDSWEVNPWLWVIEFKRVVRPTNFLS